MQNSSYPWGFPGWLALWRDFCGLMHVGRWLLHDSFCCRERIRTTSASPGTPASLKLSLGRGRSLPRVCQHPYKLLCLCLCRYYGLSVWFPDVIKHLQSNMLPIEKIEREKFSNFSVNFTMANQLHMGAEYDNGRSRNFEIT